jgi:predicted DNA-binding transcriptional regulator YafY
VNELTFTYKNWKCEISERTIDTHSINIYYGEVEWHKEEQWLMEAIDLDKKDFRTFAIQDIIGDFSLNFITDTIKHKWNIKQVK